MKNKGKEPAAEKEVAAYWERHDATEETDFEKNRVELVYQPPVKSISIRLPQPLLTELKRIAARMDVAYQALIKMWLAEKVKGVHHSES